MDLLNKLTIKNLKLNKKRTIVTIIGILLSVALITALATLVVSFQKSLIDYEKNRNGNFHYAFSKVPKEDLGKFENNRNIESVYLTKEIGYAKIDEIQNKDKPYAYVLAYDFDAIDNLGMNLLEGRKPKTSKEIVIPKHLQTNGRVRYKVGDTITLTIGTRQIEGESLDQFNPYQQEELFIGTHEMEYTIVGIMERPGYRLEDFSSPGYTFITCLDKEESGNYNVYVRYTKKGLKNIDYVIADILGVDRDIYYKGHHLDYGLLSEKEIEKIHQELWRELEKAKYDILSQHDALMAFEEGNSEDGTFKALYSVACIIVLIIIVTSVYCIRNSFNISITEKTKQYGMLASVGATKKQIKKNVLYEAFILGLIGVPLGILSGIFAAFILIHLTSYLLSSAFEGMFALQFATSLLAILLSIGLGFITIYFSAIKSAKKAAKISPIMAIRNNDDIKINAKKIKAPKIIKRIFGVGGDVSYKNIKRNNKKYRTTIISIVVCVAIFISLSSFMSLAFKVVGLEYGEMNYNLYMSVHAKENLEKVKEELLSLDGYKRYSYLNSFESSVINPRFTKEFEQHLSDEEDYYVSVISLGEEEYRRYLKTLGLQYDDVYQKGILVNDSIIYKEENGTLKQKEVAVFDYKKGDIMRIEYLRDSDDEKTTIYEIELATKTFERPLGIESAIGTQFIVISDAYMETLHTPDYFDIYADMENPDKAQDEIEKILEVYDNAHVTNYEKEAKESKSLYILVGIFLYGFITVIALIGITNIFNTITTNMELRSREFAMLKSIGMTKREFNHMIRLESLFYGMKSLLIGIPLGCLLSYLIFKALMNGNLEFSYMIPYQAIVISILAVFILITCIMKFSITKINKQNTIETIRNDNI